MAVKNMQELIDSAKAIIGENTSDEALAFMDDLSDTITDYDTKTKDNTDWKTKYEENDATWRKRYSDRFSGKPVDDEDEDDSYELPDPPKKTYLDLFEEVKNA
jgi:hypothetical protein